MSVALSIQPRGTSGAAARTVPVATQDVFKRYWLPGSEALGLKWVPLFETGIPLGKDDIPECAARTSRPRQLDPCPSARDGGHDRGTAGTAHHGAERARRELGAGRSLHRLS